jgi:hypothetical protein
MKRKIKFTGKNLNDVFSLPCVRIILKYDDGVPSLILYKRITKGPDYDADPGDELIEHDDGMWEVIKHNK